MEMVPFARTGMTVSWLCLGTGYGATVPDPDAFTQVIHAALDAGINFIDTADIYAIGDAETVLGKALKGRRDEVVLTTKFFAPMGPGANTGGCSRRWIVQAIEASLRRLQTDHVDIYLQHLPSFEVDLDEPLGAMSDLVHQGKVRYIGVSNYPAELFVEALWVSERRGHEHVICNEVPYSIMTRSSERAIFPTCGRFDAAVLAYSPLNSGWLGGRHRRHTGIQEDGQWADVVGDRFDGAIAVNQRKLEVVEALALLADEAGIPLPQLAVAWALEHPLVTSVLLGAHTPAQLHSLLPAGDIQLDSDLLDRIDALVAPGVTLDSLDEGWTPPSYESSRPQVYPSLPSLEPSARRRRFGTSQRR